MNEPRVTLAQGNGGRFMRELIQDVFVRHLANDDLDTSLDSAVLDFPQDRLVFTTDGFTVQPLEFPGGNIGSLAVHGTVNDLAVAGARPLYLSLNAIIEEGLPLAQLERIIASLANAAQEAGVRVVTGDTKVVPCGQGGGLYLVTTGIGIRMADIQPRPALIQCGDAILISGPVGDHGTAVMLAREQFGLEGDLASDSASVLPLTSALLQFDGLRFMRDPTRGGLACVVHDIVRSCQLGVALDEWMIPVNGPVRSVCEMLGYDPLYLACEGRILAVIDAAQAAAALECLRALPGAAEAACIGTIIDSPPAVILRTDIGGERMLQELEDDPLPRIC